MATESSVEISGLAELDKLLKELPTLIERNVMRSALREGQEKMLDAAKANLQRNGSVDSGELIKSLRISHKRKSEQYGWIRYHLVAGNKKAWYSHIVEYGSGSFYSGTGTKSKKQPYRITAKKKKYLLIAGGKLIKSVIHSGARPKPFMRPAWDSTNQASIEAIAQYARARIPREIKKANKGKI